MVEDIKAMLRRVRSNTTVQVRIVLLACVGVALALFFLLPYSEGYGDVRVVLYRMWRQIIGGNEDWQHCLLVPWIVFGTALWQISLAPLDKIRPSNIAFIGLLAAVFAYFIGYRLMVHYVGFFAIQGILFFAIAFSLGWRVTLQLLFPLVFLTFAWPLPFLDNVIALPLRNIMSSSAVAVLNFIGIAVVKVGTGIVSAGDPVLNIPMGQRFSVDVADPCSGIRSLFALMMVSAVYAQFSLEKTWQKILLFCCAIPLAIVGNLVRICTLTLGTIAFGTEFAIGNHALTDPSWFHMGAGYLVFVVALAGMIFLAALMRGEVTQWLQKFRASQKAANETLATHATDQPSTESSTPTQPEQKTARPPRYEDPY